MGKASSWHRVLADGRLDLPEVTLGAASSKALPATLRALRKCLDQVRPADAILFSDTCPPDKDMLGIRFVRTPRMSSRGAYSNFILKELGQHIETEFVLTVQWDGYILDARNWTDDFLAVDYIGAPWPQFDDGHDVGNGGFSLRSRRLLSACADHRISGSEAEDIAVCRSARPWLESEYGIRFADSDLARRFSYERTPPQGDEFGFHGAFNMPGLMSRSEYREMIASLDPGVLRRSDSIEQLKAAIKRRDFKIMRPLLKSMLDACPAKSNPETQH
jgi:hypothetical protein